MEGRCFYGWSTPKSGQEEAREGEAEGRRHPIYHCGLSVQALKDITAEGRSIQTESHHSDPFI